MANLDQSLRLFGSSRRTEVMIALRLLEQTYASELATLLGMHLFSVQKILRGLEAEGIVETRNVGRTRLVVLSRRFAAHRELQALLWALGQDDEKLQKKLARKRRRPRCTGKVG
jgi:hypothetical protein